MCTILVICAIFIIMAFLSDLCISEAYVIVLSIAQDKFLRKGDNKRCVILYCFLI